MSNLFDFNNVDDLPADLQGKLVSEQVDRAGPYVDILVQAADAGIEALDINQIIAVSIRLKMPQVAASTVRNYMNAAKDAGLVSKPTRQTYAAVVDAPAAVEEIDALTAAEQGVQDDDILNAI